MAVAFANIFMAKIEKQILKIEIELYWTVPRSPKGFSRVRRDASMSAAGWQIFGRRQKPIETKRKREKKKLFAWVTINRLLITKQETAHKKSLGTKGNWTNVLEEIYWRYGFPMEHKFKQNRELKITSTAEVSDTEISFLDTKVYKGVRFNKEPILDVQTYYKPTRSPLAKRSLSRTRVNHQAWRNASLKEKRSGV